MTKEVFESFVNLAKAKGITKYAIRCEGGNRIIYHDDFTGRIIFDTEKIISVQLTRNNAIPHQGFIISAITYDCIDSVLLNDIEFTDTISVIKALGAWNDDMKKFFEQCPIKRDIIPGTAGITSIKDKDGNPTLGKNSPGYVTK